MLIVDPPVTTNGMPDFGGDAHIYEGYILLRSLWMLKKSGGVLHLPAQTVALIEAVYGDEARLPNDLPADALILLRAAHERMTKNNDKARFEAKKRLTPLPNDEELIWRENDLLEEENPEIHASLQAMTRLMRPTINLVCLYGEPGTTQVALDPDGWPQVELSQEPPPDLTHHLSRRVVTVSHPAVLHFFAAQEVPSGWREHPLLHTHRLAIFFNGECPLEGTKYLLRLSSRLGLEIVNRDNQQKPS